jgi:hypothetical protein
MIRQVVDPAFVREQLDAVRAQIAAGNVEPGVVARAATVVPGAISGDAAATVLGALPLGTPGPASSGGPAPVDEGSDVPFIGRDPLVSILQTAMESRIHETHPDLIERDEAADPAELAKVPGVATWLSDTQFTTEDPRWVTEVAKAMLERLGEGNHPFNPKPAEADLADGARLILVGDWGSGLPRALAVGALMAGKVGEALSDGRQVHVIHLGDVYYSGDKGEYDSRLLAPWPVTADQAAAGVGSWSLNGNHDMYSGGWAYSDHLLADPRFRGQRCADDKPTSFLRLRGTQWDVIGLDTSWDPNPLTLGQRAVLEDPQAAFVESVAAEGRKLLVLSHHQLMSVYSPGDLGKVLPTKLAGVLRSGQIAGWIWGHEHRCMAFEATPEVRSPYCLGNGGVPVRAHPQDAPVPPPGRWEERGFLDDHGTHWGRFGFAVLDLQGDSFAVQFINDLGAVTHGPETIA